MAVLRVAASASLLSLLLALGWVVVPSTSIGVPGVDRYQVQPLSGIGGESRIVDGGDASPLQFPWQAALLTTTGKFFCGGSIIDAEWILTAGHCVDPFQEFQVIVGTLTMPEGDESTRQTFRTNDKYIHPRYDMVFLDNDIGLLKLPHKIKFSLVVSRVLLPTYAMTKEDLAGKIAFISGWGKTSDESPASPVLKYTALKILPNQECENIYGNTMINNKLCLSAEDGNSACQGDSGGALIIRRDEEASKHVIQIGITSFVSIEGCTIKMPQGFTRVSAFLDYIEDITGIAMLD